MKSSVRSPLTIHSWDHHAHTCMPCMPKCREAQRTTQRDATVVVGIVSALLVPIGRGQQRPTSIYYLLSAIFCTMIRAFVIMEHEKIYNGHLSNQGQSSLTETVVLEHHDVVVYIIHHCAQEFGQRAVDASTGRVGKHQQPGGRGGCGSIT